MRCEDVCAVFSDLYDETLSGAPLVTVTQHLSTCPACRAEWTAFRKAMQGLADLRGAEPSSDFAARVRRRIEAVPTRQRLVHWLFFPLHLKVPAHAVALALLVVAGVLLYQRSPELRRGVEPPRVVTPPATQKQLPSSPPSASREPARSGQTATPRGGIATTTPTAPRPPGPASEAAPGAGSAPPSVSREQATAAQSAPPSEPARDKETRTELQPPPAPSAPGPAAVPEPAPRQMLAAPSVAPPPPAAARSGSAARAKAAGTLYDAGLAEMAEKKYEQAARDLQSFLAQNPRDAKAAEARLHLGEAYFHQGRYADAAQQAEMVVQEFPASPFIAAALLLQGESRLAQGDGNACSLLQSLVDQYPQTSEAVSARQLISSRCH